MTARAGISCFGDPIAAIDAVEQGMV